MAIVELLKCNKKYKNKTMFNFKTHRKTFLTFWCIFFSFPKYNNITIVNIVYVNL